MTNKPQKPAREFIVDEDYDGEGGNMAYRITDLSNKEVRILLEKASSCHVIEHSAYNRLHENYCEEVEKLESENARLKEKGQEWQGCAESLAVDIKRLEAKLNESDRDLNRHKDLLRISVNTTGDQTELIARLRAQLDEAVKVIEFYTQPKIVNSQGSGWQENIYDATNKFVIGEEDFGFTARAFLSKYKGQK